MKIVVNATSARLGGGQTYLVNLFAHLPQTPDLDLLVFAPQSLALPADSRIQRVHTRWPTTNPLLRTLWERFALPRFLKRHRADVLFCPGGVVATVPPDGCKVVTMFRNMIPFDEKVRRSIPFGLQRARNWLLYRAMLRSMATADLTIFISDHARAVIERLIHVRNPVTIPHGISDVFRTGNQNLPRPERVPEGDYLLYVSRFDVYKHHFEVVCAYASLPAVLRERCRLVLVGECHTAEAARVQRLIAEKNLGDRIVVAGAVPYATLPAYYRHARAIMFASSCENCPNILLEALGAGRPVLSSNVMPMPEFGGDGIAYFSPFDPRDIARAVERLLCDESYATKVAAAALERSARYDWAATSSETWTKMAGIASNCRPGPQARS